MTQDNKTTFGSLVIAGGTTPLEVQAGILERVIILGTYVGSIELYDSASAAGTAAGNLIGTVGLPLTNAYKSIEFGFPFKKGLTVVATGTPISTIVWSK